MTRIGAFLLGLMAALAASAQSQPAKLLPLPGQQPPAPGTLAGQPADSVRITGGSITGLRELVVPGTITTGSNPILNGADLLIANNDHGVFTRDTAGHNIFYGTSGDNIVQFGVDNAGKGFPVWSFQNNAPPGRAPLFVQVPLLVGSIANGNGNLLPLITLFLRQQPAARRGRCVRLDTGRSTSPPGRGPRSCIRAAGIGVRPRPQFRGQSVRLHRQGGGQLQYFLFRRPVRYGRCIAGADQSRHREDQRRLWRCREGRQDRPAHCRQSQCADGARGDGSIQRGRGDLQHFPG